MEIKKSIILSASKGAKINEYILKKDNTIPQNLYDFFINLGVKEDNFYLYHFLGKQNRSFALTGDHRYNIPDKIFDIDVFIGKEKVILIIRTKKDMQQEISKKLFRVAKFGGKRE